MKSLLLTDDAVHSRLSTTHPIYGTDLYRQLRRDGVYCHYDAVLRCLHLLQARRQAAHTSQGWWRLPPSAKRLRR